MDDILVPMTRGNMEDIENEGRESGESALEYSSGLNTQVGDGGLQWMLAWVPINLLFCLCIWIR